MLDSRVDSVESQDENLGHSWNRNNSVNNTFCNQYLYFLVSFADI